jgi:hypothetical protein
VTTIDEKHSSWIASASAKLTSRRVRAHGIVLALGLWGAVAVDYSAPGIFDRAGNIKFQDFLPLYVTSRLIAENHTDQLYNPAIVASAIHAVVGGQPQTRLPYLYGPQVGLLFEPVAKRSFLAAARIWVSISVLVYFICICAIWNCCTSLRPYRELVMLCAVAFPPLFHFFVRGQTSALVLACFTAAYLALKNENTWLAGFALDFLFLKPQFLAAIPLVLLLAQAWKTLIGLVLSVGAQLAFTRVYFGPAVVHAYFDMIRQSSLWIDSAELNLAPLQMHSLRSFFSLLVPWPLIAFHALRAEFDLRSVAGVANVEVSVSNCVAILSPYSRGSLDQSASFRLRSPRLGPGVSASRRLVAQELTSSCETCSRCFVVPRLPAAALRPASLLDSSTTVSHRLRRPAPNVATSPSLRIADHILIGSSQRTPRISPRHLRLKCSRPAPRSQTCFHRNRRCINPFPTGAQCEFNEPRASSRWC